MTILPVCYSFPSTYFIFPFHASVVIKRILSKKKPDVSTQLLPEPLLHGILVIACILFYTLGKTQFPNFVHCALNYSLACIIFLNREDKALQVAKLLWGYRNCAKI